jgi:hypothetical protein
MTNLTFAGELKIEKIAANFFTKPKEMPKEQRWSTHLYEALSERILQ